MDTNIRRAGEVGGIRQNWTPEATRASLRKLIVEHPEHAALLLQRILNLNINNRIRLHPHYRHEPFHPEHSAAQNYLLIQEQSDPTGDLEAAFKIDTLNLKRLNELLFSGPHGQRQLTLLGQDFFRVLTRSHPQLFAQIINDPKDNQHECNARKDFLAMYQIKEFTLFNDIPEFNQLSLSQVAVAPDVPGRALPQPILANVPQLVAQLRQLPPGNPRDFVARLEYNCRGVAFAHPTAYADFLLQAVGNRVEVDHKNLDELMGELFRSQLFRDPQAAETFIVQFLQKFSHDPRASQVAAKLIHHNQALLQRPENLAVYRQASQALHQLDNSQPAQDEHVRAAVPPQRHPQPIHPQQDLIDRLRRVPNLAEFQRISSSSSYIPEMEQDTLEELLLATATRELATCNTPEAQAKFTDTFLQTIQRLAQMRGGDESLEFLLTQNFIQTAAANPNAGLTVLALLTRQRDNLRQYWADYATVIPQVIQQVFHQTNNPQVLDQLFSRYDKYIAQLSNAEYFRKYQTAADPAVLRCLLNYSYNLNRSGKYFPVFAPDQKPPVAKITLLYPRFSELNNVNYQQVKSTLIRRALQDPQLLAQVFGANYVIHDLEQEEGWNQLTETEKARMWNRLMPNSAWDHLSASQKQEAWKTLNALDKLAGWNRLPVNQQRVYWNNYIEAHRSQLLAMYRYPHGSPADNRRGIDEMRTAEDVESIKARHTTDPIKPLREVHCRTTDRINFLPLLSQLIFARNSDGLITQEKIDRLQAERDEDKHPRLEYQGSVKIAWNGELITRLEINLDPDEASSCGLDFVREDGQPATTLNCVAILREVKGASGARTAVLSLVAVDYLDELLRNGTVKYPYTNQPFIALRKVQEQVYEDRPPTEVEKVEDPNNNMIFSGTQLDQILEACVFKIDEDNPTGSRQSSDKR